MSCWPDQSYRVERRGPGRAAWTPVARFDGLRAATDLALARARADRTPCRVRHLRDTVFVAHPDGSWTGRRGEAPEAPL